MRGDFVTYLYFCPIAKGPTFLPPFQPCSSPTSSTLNNDSAPRPVAGMPPVTGVIGAAFSGVSIMVANILRLFKIPQIRENL